ncbi:2-nitropropane dioxygenase [Pluteus cervinus]|uniref:2-nitropropane dioxygenase n=1 Tax=Pluteus cervinus TaxID=181527 RepID=A0ACD3AP00_9AGAR|nr:2-nitropropane dioxygenase [Pluteus cervinus]
MAAVTKLNNLLGIKVPIISAPMTFSSTTEMAAAVASAGGFGFLGAGFDNPAQLTKTLQSVRSILNTPSNEPIPTGFGFIGWILDKTESSPEPCIPAVLAQRPKAIWFAFGDNLGKYIAQVREYDLKREHKTRVFVMVASVEQALRAANEWGADVIVAQGFEAGGHGGVKAPPLRVLLQAVLEVLPNGPPVVAAGGIATGADIASLLLTGAAGVVVGTRLLCTEESSYDDTLKQALIEAGHTATEKSRAYDEVFRTAYWPEDVDGRAIANKILDDVKDGLSLEERLKRYDESKESGKAERRVIWAGAGAGYLTKVEKTKDVVAALYEEASRLLQSAPSVLPAY